MNETYTVKKGDTLYGISNQFGVSVIDLSNINNLTNNVIQIGQELKIPGNTGSNPSSTFQYTVKKGDSLYSIAKLYKTTVNEIMKLNNIKNSNLSIGQVLRIPEDGSPVVVPPSYISYTVKKGDTLYNIARIYNISVDTILKDNGLSSPNLSIGQKLKIRTSKEGVNSIVEECFGESYEPEIKDTTYIVKKGDSLYSISKKFNTDVNTIKRKNSLVSNPLQIGQSLKI